MTGGVGYIKPLGEKPTAALRSCFEPPVALFGYIQKNSVGKNMNKSIQQSLQSISNPYNFSGHDVRTATDENGEPWFCAKDVYEALGIQWKNRSGSLTRTPEKWISTCYLQGLSGNGEVIFIKEPAVFQATFRSNKPDAIKFTEWVCEEVLPSIRKHGYFGTLPAKDLIALRNQKIKLIQELVNCRDQFAKTAYITTLRNICNQLGEPMPNTELLGQQLELEV